MITNFKLTPATLDDIPRIQEIAYKTWATAYKNVISPEQITYMLEMMYNTQTLSKLIQQPDFLFYLINDGAGIAALELHYENTISKLHKIYILPEHQGKGLGEKTIQSLTNISQNAGDKSIILNVNKKNAATHFYEKCGFIRWRSEVIDIGGDYVMDDYVYRKDFSALR